MRTRLKWLTANQLSINIKKNNYIIFKARQKRLSPLVYKLKLIIKSLNKKKSIKFLGVETDEHLSLKNHINLVAGKISRSIGIISKTKFYLSQISLFRLYYSLVYPYLYYGNIIWGATYESNLKRLKILQKRVIRIITKSSYDVNTAPLFFEHRLLDIDRIHYSTVKFIHVFCQ